MGADEGAGEGGSVGRLEGERVGVPVGEFGGNGTQTEPLRMRSTGIGGNSNVVPAGHVGTHVELKRNKLALHRVHCVAECAHSWQGGAHGVH